MPCNEPATMCIICHVADYSACCLLPVCPPFASQLLFHHSGHQDQTTSLSPQLSWSPPPRAAPIIRILPHPTCPRCTLSVMCRHNSSILYALILSKCKQFQFPSCHFTRILRLIPPVISRLPLSCSLSSFAPRTLRPLNSLARSPKSAHLNPRRVHPQLDYSEVDYFVPRNQESMPPPSASPRMAFSSCGYAFCSLPSLLPVVSTHDVFSVHPPLPPPLKPSPPPP